MSLRYRVLVLALLLSGFAVSAAEKCKQEQCHNTVVFITEHSLPGTYLNEQGVPAGVMVELVQELSRRMQQQGAYSANQGRACSVNRGRAWPGAISAAAEFTVAGNWLFSELTQSHNYPDPGQKQSRSYHL